MRFLFLGFLLLSACTKNSNENIVFEEGEVLKSSKEFKIPKDLKGKIHSEYIKYFRDLEPTSLEEDDKLVAQLPRDFLEVDMYLRQLGGGTLSGDTVFRAPRGGGLIDLADTVLGQKGSFFVRFKVRDSQVPDEDLDNLRVYYLSEVKEKKIDEKQYGSGCGSLVDISDAVLKSANGSGMRVNAKDNRYFHTMAGTYVFVSYAYEKIRLAALRIKNSSISGFECPGKK